MLYTVSAILVLFIGISLYRAHQNTKEVAVRRVQVGGTGEAVTAGPLLRVLQLSDMHLENVSISPQGLFELLKHEKLDLIALTGDYLDRKRTIAKLGPYLEVLKRLNATYGMYAVFGNHDYLLREKNFPRLRQILLDYGCRTLQNEHDTIHVRGLRVNLIGIDDHSTRRSDLASSYRGLKKGFNFILTHDPNIVLHMGAYRFDYLLSGHFHGGQICWPKPYHIAKMGKLARLNIIKGLHYMNGRPFYISEGLGQTGINIRIGSRPEITIHELMLQPSAAK